MKAHILGHRFGATTGMANQEGARGDLAPTVGTDKPTNDTHRAYSPDDDGICVMELITSG
jgi:hypothetical protein